MAGRLFDARPPDRHRQSLRRRILAGEPTVGTFLNLGSRVSAEICAMAGFDWVLIDLEHGSGTNADLLGQLQAITGTGATPLVRVELTARTLVSRALDPGAGGVMFPRIDSAAEAREAVSYLRFPPDGVRGVAAQNRTGRFGRVPIGELGALDDDLIGVVQVETLGSLDDIDAIAAVDGVDVLFVGPGDLTYALGVPGRTDDPSYRRRPRTRRRGRRPTRPLGRRARARPGRRDAPSRAGLPVHRHRIRFGARHGRCQATVDGFRAATERVAVGYSILGSRRTGPLHMRPRSRSIPPSTTSVWPVM